MNKNNNSYYYFLLNLKDHKKENTIHLKIENLFHINFNFENKISSDDDLIEMSAMSLNDSMISLDSNFECFEKDENHINKEEKMKGIQKVNQLVGRLRDINTLMNIKNITLDEYINEDKKHEQNNKEKNDITNSTINSSKELHNFLIDENNMEQFKKFASNEIIIDDYIPNHRNTALERKNRMQYFGEKEDYENILSTIDYQSYLEEQKELKKDKKNQSKRETFCSGFFITSFPNKNASLIEKSEDFPASCSHKPCSTLKSMKPEILMRYPLEDNDEVEINNLSATLCFPTGIKLCHCMAELRPEKMDDYLTLLTNRKGERLYIMTYHFYLRMEKKEFDQKYEIYPLKIKLKELDEQVKKINFEIIDDKTLNVFEEIKVCKEFENRNHLYIPYCLALISKYPYIQQVKQSIYCIFKIIEHQIKDNNLELNELLMYLIHSIPIPNINTSIKFPLPYFYQNEIINKKNNLITLEAPKFKDINTLNSNICEILKIFKIKNIIRIFRLLLFEKKIIFIDSDYARLSNVINSFLSLIYPFQWNHVYIPILSIPMIKYLETFLPFLVGVHSSFIPHIKKILTDNSDENEQVFLIFIEDDKVRISDYFKEESKRMNKTNFLHKNLTNLPVWMYIMLKLILNNIKSKMKKIRKEEASQFNFEIQNAFIEIFVEMFSDYNKYIYKVGDEAVFNKNLFMSKKNVLEKKFYREFIETQMFLQFKQDILEEGYEYFKLKVSERNSNSHKDKYGQTTLEKTRTVINEYHQDKKIYLIKPKFINIITENENNLIKSNYIINYLKNIENEKFDKSKCTIYLMPTLQTIGIMVRGSGKLDQKTKNDELNKNNKENEDKNRKFQMHKIEEELKNYILKIFKSDEVNINDDEYKNILKIITNEEKGRQYFIKLISHNLTKVIILPKNSFDILFHLIYEIILIFITQIDTSENLFNDAVLLVKSTQNYGKEEKSKIITIWDLCKEKLMENSIMYHEKFWNEWYYFEINNNMNLNGILLNDVKNKILISIAKTMKDLKMEKSCIIYYTNNIIKNQFEKDFDLIDKTKRDILDLFK